MNSEEGDGRLSTSESEMARKDGRITDLYTEPGRDYRVARSKLVFCRFEFVIGITGFDCGFNLSLSFLRSPRVLG